MTKKETYLLLKELVDNAEEVDFELPEETTFDQLRDWIDNEIEVLNHKAASAAKRAEKKKAEGDELCDRILALMTNENQTLKEIINQLGDETISDQKVSNRIAKLVKSGQVTKEKITVASADETKSKKAMAYRLAE